MRMFRVVLLVILAALTGCNIQPSENDMPSTEFSTFVDDYFNALFEWAPAWGTSAGFHEYDARFEDYSAAARARRIDTLLQFQARLTDLRGKPMPSADAIDSEFLDSQIRAELMDLESPLGSLRNPMSYVGLPGSSIDGLMKRNFAPAADRLRSVISRLRGIPALMNALRENVQNPPRELTERCWPSLRR
jgi:uncharacterized protein (DUF885 family)